MSCKIQILFLFLTLSLLVVEARAGKSNKHTASGGIQWVSGLTWAQIKNQAHDENKFIFMDCFATWCGPCKNMDKQVYPNDTIGSLMNSNFICVRLQMDSTKKDNGEIRKWYATVKTIEKEYNVTAMPTFLFFAPDGKIVHKEVGSRNVKQFISLIASARDQSKQYYTLLRLYRENKLDYTALPSLANMARANGERVLAFELARGYMTGFLDHDEQRYFVKENQQFIYSFYGILRSSDHLFNFYLQEPAVMDTLLGKPGSSQKIVDYVITEDEITPTINQVKEKSNEQVWKKIASNIREKYGQEYAERTVLNARIDYYRVKKEWSQYSKHLVQKVQMEERQGLLGYASASSLNDYSWDIFLYSNCKADLKKALLWSERSLHLIDSSSFNVGPYMDTKANLLYKLGRNKSAIKLEERALGRIIADSDKYNFMKGAVENYKKILQNMKDKKTTYLEEGAIWKKNKLNK
jgi:thioredoxin-related protein